MNTKKWTLIAANWTGSHFTSWSSGDRPAAFGRGILILNAVDPKLCGGGILISASTLQGILSTLGDSLLSSSTSDESGELKGLETARG